MVRKGAFGMEIELKKAVVLSVLVVLVVVLVVAAVVVYT